MLTEAAHGYCLLYPVGYAYDQPNERETVIYVGSLLDVEHPKVFIEVTEAGGQSAEQIAEALVAEVKQAMPDFQVERRADLLIGGEPATQLDHMPGQDISRQVLVVHHGRLYKLTFIPADKTAGALYQQMEGLYSTILDSFNFLGAKN